MREPAELRIELQWAAWITCAGVHVHAVKDIITTNHDGALVHHHAKKRYYLKFEPYQNSER